jgi:hypothetical protein
MQKGRAPEQRAAALLLSIKSSWLRTQSASSYSFFTSSLCRIHAAEWLFLKKKQPFMPMQCQHVK